MASLIGKNWISWYGYLFETNEIVQEFFQIKPRKVNEKADFYDLIIDLPQIRPFLRKCYKYLRKNDDTNFNIKMVIIYLINGNETNYLEAQFTTTFLALEKLKDIYSMKFGLDKNMKVTHFNKFQSRLSEFIKNSETENTDSIIEKLPELNRPSFSYILERMLTDYDVKWEDLYPKGSELTLIKTRNSLFHSSKHPDFECIIKEYERLQILMYRLILRILSWPDFGEITDIHKLKFITE